MRNSTLDFLLQGCSTSILLLTCCFTPSLRFGSIGMCVDCARIFCGGRNSNCSSFMEGADALDSGL